MKRSCLTLCVVVVAFALAACNAARADIVYDLNLPGIGTQIPITSFSFPLANTLSVTRPVDQFSPPLFLAVAAGTSFSTGSLDTYDTSFSATIPITSFEMTDILLTSIQLSGGGEIPTETVTLRYQTGALVSVPEPSSLMLLGSGALGLIKVIRRKLRA